MFSRTTAHSSAPPPGHADDRARPGIRLRPQPLSISVVLLTGLLSLCLGATAGACGGSSSAAVESPPAATTAASVVPGVGTAPLGGTAAEAAAEFWRLMNAGDHDALNAALSPTASTTSLQTESDDIAGATLIRVDEVSSVAGSAPPETLVQTTVLIKPEAGGESPTPWGEIGKHTLFLRLQKAEAEGWYWTSWGTSP